MISEFFDTEFAIERMEWESGLGGADLAATGSFFGQLQQASALLVRELGLTLSKSFAVWCAVGTDIQEGDQIVADDVRYTVRGVMKNDIGENKHLELIVERYG